MRKAFVYILASQRNGTLYIGMTTDLSRLIYEHKNNLISSFTQKHGVHLLVYVEAHEHIETAIQREKNLKDWKREWKLRLIEENNPEWADLSVEALVQ